MDGTELAYVISSHDTLHNLCASVQAETKFGQPQIDISFSTKRYVPSSLANAPLRRFYMTQLAVARPDFAEETVRSRVH